MSDPEARRRFSRFQALPDTRADRTEVLIWARALMVPGSKVMLIDAGNGNAGWVPLEVAILSGRPFAIKVRDDVLAVDSDNPEMLPTLLHLADALHQDGLRPALLRSGQPGHAHLWVHIPAEDLRTLYKQRARNAGFDVREGNKLCRPPYAPHRQGRPVATLLTPDRLQESLRSQRALQQFAGEQRTAEIEATHRRLLNDRTWSLSGRCSAIPADPAAPRGATSLTKPATAAPIAKKADAGPTTRSARPLSRKMDRLLRDGLPHGQRSEGIWAFLVWAANNAWRFDLTLAHLMDTANTLGSKVREKKNPQRWLFAQWKKAQAFVVANPPRPRQGAVRSEVTRLRHAVDAAYWSSVAGATDRRILLAHLDIVDETAKLDHGASVREVAERAFCVAETVTRSHRRLRTDGWLRLVRGYRPGTRASAIWRVQVPAPWRDRARKIRTLSTPRGGVQETVRGVHTLAPHDIWTREGLGPSCGLVWSQTDASHGVRPKVLAELLGNSPSTIRRHLARLRKHALLVRGPGGWLRGPASLDSVAQALGVVGTLARQRALHSKERQIFGGRVSEHLPRKVLVSAASI